MVKKSSFCSIPFLVLFCAILGDAAGIGEEGCCVWERRVKREHRRRLVSTEYGEISSVRVGDSIKGSYLLHFFTLEPNSLLLPVMLHSEMVFYVHTGSGKLSWTERDDLKTAVIRRGDIHRLNQGSVFFMQSNLETETETDTNLMTGTERQKLRIHAIFADENYGLHPHESVFEPYTSIRDMVLGFDKKVLQAAFKVPAEVIDELFNRTETPAIIHVVSQPKRLSPWETEAEFVRGVPQTRIYNILEVNKTSNTGNMKLFNIFKENKDFVNCNGWSTTVTKKKLSVLRGSNIGLFMVNLTVGTMMGPHWNPTATEVAVVLRGRGMVRVVCPGGPKESVCRNVSFAVEEGDVFVVPRFHAMAQMAFNNETFVFMGFSTSVRMNHPQFFAGKASVLRTLNKDVLAKSFNVANTTLDQLLTPQRDSVILRCISCAEEEWRVVKEDRQREREEAREREEEEARKWEEEKRREEEEARKKEEEARRQEEEKRRQEEEARRQEEEKERQEEEARRQEEEKKRQEEEAKREEEERRQREQEEEERRQREQEEERQREEQEARSREEQERAAEEERHWEEERERQREEEEREEEEEARSREEQEQAADNERQWEKEARQQEKERKRREKRKKEGED